MKHATKKRTYLIGFVDCHDDTKQQEYVTRATSKEAAINELLSELDPDIGGDILYVDTVSVSGRHTQVYMA